jgi:hypothetical protein
MAPRSVSTRLTPFCNTASVSLTRARPHVSPMASVRSLRNWLEAEICKHVPSVTSISTISHITSQHDDNYPARHDSSAPAQQQSTLPQSASEIIRLRKNQHRISDACFPPRTTRHEHTNLLPGRSSLSYLHQIPNLNDPSAYRPRGRSTSFHAFDSLYFFFILVS